jgi:hypothetical protein
MLEQRTEGTGIVGTPYSHRQHIGRALHGRTANLAFILHKNPLLNLIFFYYSTVSIERKIFLRVFDKNICFSVANILSFHLLTFFLRSAKIEQSNILSEVLKPWRKRTLTGAI